MRPREITILLLVCVVIALVVPLALVASVAIFWSLPLLAMLGLAASAFYGRRLRTAARDFPCVTCGAPLGAASVTLARKTMQQQVRRLRREHPWAAFRLYVIDAICIRCGTPYQFSHTDRTFHIDTTPPPELLPAR